MKRLPEPVFLSSSSPIARSIDADLRLGPVREIPVGKGEVIDEDRAWIVIGRRKVIEHAERVRAIDGVRVAEVSLRDGRVIRESPDLPEPKAAAGIDASGRPVVGHGNGFWILDQKTLKPLAGVHLTWGGIQALAMLGDRSGVAVLANWWGLRERLIVATWT